MNIIFFGEPEYHKSDIDSARIVILPLCYENAVSYGKGAGSGPLHILNASAQLEVMDEETFINWGQIGIHTLPPMYFSQNPEKAVLEMKEAAKDVLSRNKFLLSLGGDHAISIGPIMAAADIFPNLGVLQVDAHLDLRDTWNGSRFNHACVMRRVVDDIGLSAVQVGIRSFSPEEAGFIQDRRLSPFFAHNISPNDQSWIDQVIDRLPENVYLTIDLDGLDPSALPGTGTPEPGGLEYRQLVSLIRAVGKSRKVVAADINELSKIEGTNVSEFTAAKLATKIFVYCV